MAEPENETDQERQDRQRKVATDKFELLETVAADPECNPSDLTIILAYSKFMPRLGGSVFRSSAQLQALTGLSEPAIRARRKVLVKRGYLEPNGYTRKGVPYFKVHNPHRNSILDHVAIKTETLRELEASRREKTRQRRAALGSADPKKSFPLGSADPKKSGPTDRKNFGGNTYSEYVEGLSSEEEATSQGWRCPNHRGRHEGGDFVYAAPDSEADCDRILTEILWGVQIPEAARYFLRVQLMRGALRQSWVDQQLELAA